jgi:hypothetical protein
VHDEFGRDQDGKRDEKSDMCFDVSEKREPIRRSVPWSEHDEQQERQPHDRGDDQDSSIQQLEVVALEVRSPEELEERTAEDK